MITTQQLNQVAELLGTTDKNAVIGAVLKTLIDARMSVDAAFDGVFGAGAYLQFAGEIHAALTAA